jgi:hypothetical protein
MKRILVIGAVLFGVPLLTLVWLLAVHGKVLVVRNPNHNAVSIQVATQNDLYTETTEPRAVGAGALTWLIFKPQIGGESGLLCTGMRGTTRIPLAEPGHPLPMFSRITLDSCEGAYVLRMIHPHRPAGGVQPPRRLN